MPEAGLGPRLRGWINEHPLAYWVTAAIPLVPVQLWLVAEGYWWVAALALHWLVAQFAAVLTRGTVRIGWMLLWLTLPAIIVISGGETERAVITVAFLVGLAAWLSLLHWTAAIATRGRAGGTWSGRLHSYARERPWIAGLWFGLISLPLPAAVLVLPGLVVASRMAIAGALLGLVGLIVILLGLAHRRCSIEELERHLEERARATDAAATSG